MELDSLIDLFFQDRTAALSDVIEYHRLFYTLI